jgi:hypothetical protein
MAGFVRQVKGSGLLRWQKSVTTRRIKERACVALTRFGARVATRAGELREGLVITVRFFQTSKRPISFIQQIIKYLQQICV